MQGQRTWPGLAVTLLLLGGCGVRVAPEERLVFQYSEGIQSLHEGTYKSFFLACHPDSPYRDITARMTAYEDARKKGTIDFSPDGIELIRLGALGRGAYFRVHEVEKRDDHLRFKTLLQPDYLSINFTEFPPNAVLYIMGEPLGSVIRLKPGKIPGPQRSILQSVDLMWDWKKLPHAPPEDWCLQSLAPLPGSAEFKKLQFREETADPGSASR
jgi:hypothetical protein